MGAELLNLNGPVTTEDFASLLDGRSPAGELLTQNRASNRRSGFDLTLSAPKSVSIAALALDDAQIREAHARAVRDTLTRAEGLAQSRIKRKGKVTFVNTHNAIFATFEHTGNRNLDPQLHTHSILMNATQLSGKWRSLYAREIFQRIKRLGKFYRDRLSDLVRALGHKLRTAGEYWELLSIPQRLIDKFSSRKQEILEFVGENASSRAKKYAALITRNPKQSSETYQKPVRAAEKVTDRER